MNIQQLMETNVYTVKGKVLIVGSCFPQVYPEEFAKLSAGVDQVYSLCLETTHINMAITKLSAVFGTGLRLRNSAYEQLCQNRFRLF